MTGVTVESSDDMVLTMGRSRMATGLSIVSSGGLVSGLKANIVCNLHGVERTQRRRTDTSTRLDSNLVLSTANWRSERLEVFQRDRREADREVVCFLFQKTVVRHALREGLPGRLSGCGINHFQPRIKRRWPDTTPLGQMIERCQRVGGQRIGDGGLTPSRGGDRDEDRQQSCQAKRKKSDMR